MFGHEPESAALVRDPDLLPVEGLIHEVEKFLPELCDRHFHDFAIIT